MLLTMNQYFTNRVKLLNCYIKKVDIPRVSRRGWYNPLKFVPQAIFVDLRPELGFSGPTFQILLD